MWTISGTSPIATVAHAGFVEGVPDSLGDFGPPTPALFWVVSDVGPTVGTNRTGNDDILDCRADSMAYTLELSVNVAPVAVCQNVVVEADENCEADVTPEDVDAGSFDPNGDVIGLTLEPPGPYPLGDTVVDLIATDPFGLSDTCQATITVVDVTPPQVTVTLSPDELWPPNHKMVEITATVTVTDNCSPPSNITVNLVSITSDEPDDGLGDGNTEDDIAPGPDDFTFYLRSERAGGGDGRVYTVTYSATDEAGNQTDVTEIVMVPHDQSSPAMAGIGLDLGDAEFMGGTFSLIVPSSPEFNARSVDLSQALIGNHRGRLAPIEHRFVVGGNGGNDLVLVFGTQATRTLMQPVIEHPGKKDRIREIDKDAPLDPVAFRFVTSDGTGFLAPDLFLLDYVPHPEEDGTRDDWTLPPAMEGDRIDLSPRGELTLSLGAGGSVQVDVFSVLGRKVRTLAKRTFSPGLHVMKWSGTDDSGRRLPNGVYFYRVQTPEKTLVKKIHLIR
jgi:hypothetical protein